MKIVVSSPFRTGNSWLVGLLCRTLNFEKADFGTVTPAGLDNLQDNTVVRTNSVVTSANLGTATGIRLLRNISDAVASKLIYGVTHYIGKSVSVSPAFQSFLNEVAGHDPFWRTPKNCVELALDSHIGVVNQFIRENLIHTLADSTGMISVTYEELCHDAGQWVKTFADSKGLTCVRNPWQVNINMAPSADPSLISDITVSNWCATNISQESARKLNNRIASIRALMQPST